MSTVAEIEAAIEKLRPEDVRTLHHWIAERAAKSEAREWTPEELVDAAQRMIDEPDRTRSDAIKEEIIRGFYGPENA
jgi:hypothetical protein